MSVSREEAVYAYRLILGREPENEEVIVQAMAAQNLAHLRQVFLGSQEFCSKYDGSTHRSLQVGRYFDVSGIDIDIDCTPEQLQAMFDRIAHAWQAFGETEPHWSVLVSEDYRSDNIEENISQFYASGFGDIDVHLNFLRRASLPTSFRKALDFGCGVGRLTLAMAPHAGQVIGVDISPPHLRLATERATATCVDNVQFESIASVNDLDRYEGFDLIVCRIVLQHNPPPVIAALYARLLSALAPAGVAIVQIPTYIHGQSFAAADYLASEQPQMEMNCLPQQVIFRIIEESGCRLIEVREDVAAGEGALSHVFFVQKAVA